MEQEPALAREMETYRARFAELQANEGKFVLIHRDEVGGIYETYGDAIKVGYEKFKLEPFLVKKIASTEVAQFITRLVGSCPA